MRHLMLFFLALVLCTGQMCGQATGGDSAQTATNGAAGAGSGSQDATAGGTGTGQQDGTATGGSSGSADTTGGGGGPAGGATNRGAIIADHLAAAAFDAIPITAIQAAQSTYRIWYGHTSHGSQLVTGMQMLYSADARYAFNAGAGSLSLQEQTDVDLGYEGNLDWVATTRDILNAPGNNINVVMWSWCGGVSENTEAGIADYLTAMNQLETDYPSVTFVYMTGHLDGSGPDGNLYARNEQIRRYCRTNNKVLYDFADIESYDPAGNYYPDGTDWCEWCEAWCTTHTCPACEDCAHSQCINCYQKGRAFWWMMARLAGWSGG
ncbi:MAG: hypothetical protein ACPMAQ_14560 [Phycisphaerae bacterium]